MWHCESCACYFEEPNKEEELEISEFWGYKETTKSYIYHCPFCANTNLTRVNKDDKQST